MLNFLNVTFELITDSQGITKIAQGQSMDPPLPPTSPSGPYLLSKTGKSSRVQVGGESAELGECECVCITSLLLEESYFPQFLSSFDWESSLSIFVSAPATWPHYSLPPPRYPGRRVALLSAQSV